MADVATGLQRSGRPADAMGYRTIALVCVDRDGSRARDIIRPVMAEFLAEFADMSTVTLYRDQRRAEGDGRAGVAPRPSPGRCPTSGSRIWRSWERPARSPTRCSAGWPSNRRDRGLPPHPSEQDRWRCWLRRSFHSSRRVGSGVVDHVCFFSERGLRMDLGLRGCAAIVGGASSGMGRAVARRLAEEGCDVTLLARRRELLDEAVAEISALTDGGRAHAVAGDSTAPADLTRTVEETMRRSSGGSTSSSTTPADRPPEDFGDFDDEDWGAGRAARCCRRSG